MHFLSTGFPRGNRTWIEINFVANWCWNTDPARPVFTPSTQRTACFTWTLSISHKGCHWVMINLLQLNRKITILSLSLSHVVYFFLLFLIVIILFAQFMTWPGLQFHGSATKHEQYVDTYKAALCFIWLHKLVTSNFYVIHVWTSGTAKTSLFIIKSTLKSCNTDIFGQFYDWIWKWHFSKSRI